MREPKLAHILVYVNCQYENNTRKYGLRSSHVHVIAYYLHLGIEPFVILYNTDSLIKCRVCVQVTLLEKLVSAVSVT